jgi:anti-sigma regulatory factor (Ser/Thr protein kinase)
VCVTLVELRLPAAASELKRVRDCVTAAAADFGLDARARYEFVFAVNEAVTNAIKHGRPDENGTIGLTLEVEGEALVCSVSDCGSFVRPTAAPDLALGESGRGFAFMTAFTDDVELLAEPDSTVVRLRRLRAVEALVPNA